MGITFFEGLEAGAALAVADMVMQISRLLGLQIQTLVTALICAGLGTAIIARFTQSLGALGYTINFMLLFAGAVIANRLLRGWELPFEYAPLQPVAFSLGGMAVASLVILIVLSKDRYSS